MIFNFNNLSFDEYDHLEQPVLLLQTMTGTTICPISNYYNLEASIEFNDVSQITFEVPSQYIVDDVLYNNPSFDQIKGMRLIKMAPFGVFVLKNPSVTDDGIVRTKKCTAYSLEYELNYKQTDSLDATYMFYDTTGESGGSIMDIILEKIPNWSIDHVDANVATRYRTFSSSSESIYSFMMNTLQESYSCIFIFDTNSRTINVYDSQSAVTNEPIFLSKQNLIINENIEELSDEIVTCLGVYGADDADISTVNPLGTAKIYNLDYFIEIGDISPALASKWQAWNTAMETYQKMFSKTFTQYYLDLANYNAQNARLIDLQGEQDALEAVMDTYKTDTVGDHTAEKTACQASIDTKEGEVTAQETVVETAEAKVTVDVELMSSIASACALSNNFTAEELQALNSYLKEDSIQESSYVISNINDEPSECISVKSIDGFTLSITKGDLYQTSEYDDLSSDDYAKVGGEAALKAAFKDMLDTYLGYNFYTINSGAITIGDISETFALTGTVTNSSLSYNAEVNGSENYNCMVSLNIDKVTFNDVEYPNATLVFGGELSGFTYECPDDEDFTDTLSFNMTSGILSVTFESSIYQRQNTIQDLYNYGVECLDKLASPSYEFSVDSANIFYLPEFESFKNSLGLGKSINLEFSDGVYRQPILIGVDFSFGDASKFALKFSDKYRSNDSEYKLADVIGQTAQTSANLDANKFSYAAFSNSTIKNDVESLISSAFDLSKKSIVNATNQNILIDGQGIHLRKATNAAGTIFDPCEVRLINNQIVFTDDAWATAGLAIGKLSVNTDGTPRTVMGVVANSLIGNVIIGNKLTIEATGTDSVTGLANTVHFRVDGSGAYLGNASFALQAAGTGGVDGNKLLIDPRYGLIAGSKDLFTIGSSGVVANFIDENGDVIFDENGYMPAGASLFFNSENGNAYFKGNVYADDGYFNGTINATSGNFSGSINIGDGTFAVDDTGAMSASDATVSGDITCNKLTISNGATVSGLVVGENVTMGPNAVITWSQLPSGVASTSDIPAGVSDAHITEITKSTIATNSITASDLTITGGSVNISTAYDTESKIKLSYGTRNISLCPAMVSVADGNNEVFMNRDGLYTGEASYTRTMMMTGYAIIDELSCSSLSVNGKTPVFQHENLIYANNFCVGTSTTTSNAYCGFNGLGYLQKYSGSSQNYKHNIHSLTDDLKSKFNQLYNIEVKNWTYNSNYIDETDELYEVETFGLIAEDVQSILPEAVVHRDGQVENYRDRHILNAMLYLLQEQKKEITLLQSRLDILEQN